MEVENGPVIEETSLVGTHSPLPWLWEEELVMTFFLTTPFLAHVLLFEVVSLKGPQQIAIFYGVLVWRGGFQAYTWMSQEVSKWLVNGL